MARKGRVKKRSAKAPKRWTIGDSRDLYLIDKWGQGYLDVSRRGNLGVRPARRPGVEVVVKELREHSPEIVSTELTKTLERDMMAIQEQKKKRSEVIEKARKFLEKNLAAFKKNEKKIGKSLLKAVRKVMKEESTIGPCKCGGELMIRMSRAKKRFVGCTNYPKCTETFSLPQHGYLTIISEKCKKCGLNIVSVRSAGKRPWKLCVRCGYVNVRKPNGKKKEKTAAVKK